MCLSLLIFTALHFHISVSLLFSSRLFSSLLFSSLPFSSLFSCPLLCVVAVLLLWCCCGVAVVLLWCCCAFVVLLCVCVVVCRCASWCVVVCCCCCGRSVCVLVCVVWHAENRRVWIPTRLRMSIQNVHATHTTKMAHVGLSRAPEVHQK